MKKLFQLLRSLFKRRNNKSRKHTCEELDYPFFSFSLLLTVFLLTVQTVAADAAELYTFVQHVNVENSKANEYVSFKAHENIFGLGFATHIIEKNKDKLDLRVGLGKSSANIDISQTITLGKTYTVEKSLNYNTGMYLFSVSYSYNISKSFSVTAELEQSKNALKRNVYMLKLSYNF